MVALSAEDVEPGVRFEELAVSIKEGAVLSADSSPGDNTADASSSVSLLDLETLTACSPFGPR